ncbi:MAG: hypothetical protein E7080_08250 [Bacteroidales bacterium]|nr:hypothetical protein [Bacteroidales bacterium]
MRRLAWTVIFVLCGIIINATIPTGYYNSAEGKNKGALLEALELIVGEHKTLGYGDLWDLYYESDVTSEGYIWDMYSTSKYTPGRNQCGSYSKIGDCYNREHSFPKSWFDDRSPMYSDAFHIYPTDGKVNGQRSNYPFGECANGSYVSSSGGVKALGRLGSSTFSGYSGTVFEPDDQYKGDFARSYFYMAAAYNSYIDDWSSAQLAGNSYPCFSDWSVNLLMKWHREDPVSEKEINRNEVVYRWQGNRNPFIDHPELAEYVWGTKKNEGWTEQGTVSDPIIISPDANELYDCGVVAVNKSISIEIPLKTVGITEELTAVMVDNENFSVSPREINVDDAKKGINLVVTFSPRSAGTHTAKLQIYNGEVNTEVTIRGMSVDGIPALSATDVTYDGFTAHWTDVDNGAIYKLVVFESDGVAEVAGYPIEVASNLQKYVVSGLNYETDYFYQLLCENRVSNKVKVTTSSPNRILTFNNIPEGGLVFTAAPGEPSAIQEVSIYTEYVEDKINVSVTGNFELSMDNATWSDVLSNIDSDGEIFFVRMKATETEGKYAGVLSLSTATVEGAELDIKGVVEVPRAFFEDFEAMETTGYATGTYEGTACSWVLKNTGAYGRSSQDHFNGTKALCTGKSGTRLAEMAEDKTNGLGTLSFVAAPFGNDGAVVVDVSYSIDGGATWSKIATETISLSTLTEYSYEVNVKGNVRIKFEQKSGKRLNIDDVEITDYSDNSSVNEIAVLDWIAYGVENGVEIEASSPMLIEVYSMEGMKIYSRIVSPGKNKIQLDKGVYVIVSDDDSKKVIVK